MGHKARNAGKKKSKQFAPKLATVKSISPTAGAQVKSMGVLQVSDLAALTGQQQSELIGNMYIERYGRPNQLCFFNEHLLLSET